MAVCNLASIAVNMFIKSNGDYDFEKLLKITKIVTKNLNKVIDVNFYPVIEVIQFYNALRACIFINCFLNILG